MLCINYTEKKNFKFVGLCSKNLLCIIFFLFFILILSVENKCIAQLNLVFFYFFHSLVGSLTICRRDTQIVL